MTGVQEARRFVCLSPREVGKAANRAERRFRPLNRRLLREDRWDRIPAKPDAIDWDVS